MPEVAKAVIPAAIRAYDQTVTDLVGSDPNHGWGAKDSEMVIDAVIAADAEEQIPLLIAAGKAPTAYCPSVAAMAMIRRVINPSAHRQMLEKAKRKDGSPVLNKSEGEKKRGDTPTFSDM
jgi:hypothetical protein